MIPYVILKLLVAFTGFLLTPLTNQPDVVLSSTFTTTIIQVSGFLSFINVFPFVGALLAVTGIMFTIEIAIFFYKAIMWLIKKIPTIN